MLPRGWVLLLLVAIGCGLTAGCGSSSSSTASQTTGQSSTPAQSTTSTPATTATTPDADIAGKLDTLPNGPAEAALPSPPTTITAATEEQYLTAVFNDAQRFWDQEFRAAGAQYAPARARVFASVVHSGCGAQADTGPFYCPANRTIYLDLSFFELLAHQAGIGPFGQAYIIGHELGHHVQHLTGIDVRVAALDQQDPSGSSARSVAVELQADCLAGVWAHSVQARGELTEADLIDALKTATVVGDDFQQRAAGRVVDSSMWTHGSSEQRQQWLTTGFKSGKPDACDTFAGAANR